LAQNRIATERISFKLVTLFHVGERILFRLCQLGRMLLAFSFGISPVPVPHVPANLSSCALI
jgi:hypothetical protein